MGPMTPATGASRVLLLDDHPVVRQGIRLMINAEPDLAICGEAHNEQEARRLVRELKPDAMLVYLSQEQGDGFNVVRDIRAQRERRPALNSPWSMPGALPAHDAGETFINAYEAHSEQALLPGNRG